MQKFKESVIFREAAYYGRNIGICGVGGQRDACPAPQSTKENPGAVRLRGFDFFAISVR